MPNTPAAAEKLRTGEIRSVVMALQDLCIQRTERGNTEDATLAAADLRSSAPLQVLPLAS